MYGSPHYWNAIPFPCPAGFRMKRPAWCYVKFNADRDVDFRWFIYDELSDVAGFGATRDAAISDFVFEVGFVWRAGPQGDWDDEAKAIFTQDNIDRAQSLLEPTND